MATLTIEGTDHLYDQPIIGSDAVADTLAGTDDLVRYYIAGLGLNDNLSGRADDDILVGGFGCDILKGRAGDDLLIGDHLDADGSIVSELDFIGMSHGSVSPPGGNANWKAWENYENRLKDFFDHLDPTLTYKLNGVVMTAQELSAAWGGYNEDLTLDDVHVITGKKIENTNGNDTKNHDITDNLALWAHLAHADEDQTDSAAFLDFGTVQAFHPGDDVVVIDTAVFSGPSSNYTLLVSPDSVSVRDNVGTDGLDTLVGIKQMKFSDVTLDTSWFCNVASVPGHQLDDLTDMYIAYFDRAPDAQYLANKHAVGVDFALNAGLSDTGWARAVMQGVGGSAASVAAAQTQIDHYSATASAGGHLVVELVGIAG